MKKRICLKFFKNWQDERLAYGKIDTNNSINQDAEYLVVPTLFDRLWFPDLYFYQERRGHFHDIVTPNKDSFLNVLLFFTEKV